MKYLEAIIYTEVHEFCDSKGLQITLRVFEGVGAQKYRQRKKNETISFLSPFSLILAPRFEAHKLPNLTITDKKKTRLFCLTIWSGTSA